MGSYAKVSDSEFLDFLSFKLEKKSASLRSLSLAEVLAGFWDLGFSAGLG